MHSQKSKSMQWLRLDVGGAASAQRTNVGTCLWGGCLMFQIGRGDDVMPDKCEWVSILICVSMPVDVDGKKCGIGDLSRGETGRK